MSNPDSSTPSIQARDKAVKPAGMAWEEFEKQAWLGNTRAIALAYAAHLDKADKERREVLADLEEAYRLAGSSVQLKKLLSRSKAILRANLLPDPQPTLYEQFVQAVPHARSVSADFTDGVHVALDWIAKRELAKEQDRG